MAEHRTGLPDPVLSDRFTAALQLAVDLHRRQTRKGTPTPYMAHLLGVSSLALEHGADEDEAIAALLHDAVEDQGGRATLAHIRALFGERVASIVDGCSESHEEPKPQWGVRKKAYVRHLAVADSSVLLVVGSDKLYNAMALLSDLRAFGDVVWARFNAERDETLWFYRAVTAACIASPAVHERPLLRILIERLDSVVTALEGDGRRPAAPPRLHEHEV